MTGSRALALVVLLAVGTAGCAVPAPRATPRAVSAMTAAPTAGEAGPTPTVPEPSASASPAPRGLAAELEIERVDRRVSESIGEFASTGSAIIFSSSLAEDASPDAAPDLWRIVPGPDPSPELVWRNPSRDHVLTRLAGDLETIAFVDLPLSGEPAWDLWVVPRGGEPILLDSHPGDPSVSSLVPSIAIYEPSIAWTAFDIGPQGAVSQLLVATAPEWRPRVLAERPAAEAELWLPSLEGSTIAYTEVVYAADRSSDERHVVLGSIDQPPEAHARIDASGLATMPLVVGSDVIWKEADPGFNMFNWGRLYRWSGEDGTAARMRLGAQEYVNYPSVGSRFVTWWGAATNELGVFDLVRGHARTIERYPADGSRSIARPHVAWDLIAWMVVDADSVAGRSTAELRYAFLPPVKEPDR